MLYSLVPLLIIFLSLAGIILIVVRKFPQLSALEVEKIEEVKQAKVKQALALQRFERALKDIGRKIKPAVVFLSFFDNKWKKWQTDFRAKFFQVSKKYKEMVTEEAEKTVGTLQEKGDVSAKDLLEQAEQVYLRGDLSMAERKYIEVIKKDPRNIEAYRGIGKVYLDTDKDKEAYETFKFIIKLNPTDDRAYNRLGMIAEKVGDYEAAAKYFEESIKIDRTLAIRHYDLGRIYARLNKPATALKCFLKAVKIEPNNPKYLDQLLEMSIITRDKELAEQILSRLAEVNPENQKLEDFKERVEEIEEI